MVELGPTLEAGGPSIEKTLLKEGVAHGNDDEGDEDNLVSFYDIIVAADAAVDAFETSVQSGKGVERFVFSTYSSKEDFPYGTELEISSSEGSYQSMDTNESDGFRASSQGPEVIIFSSDSDKDDDLVIYD